MKKLSSSKTRMRPTTKTKSGKRPNELTKKTLKKSVEGKELHEVVDVSQLFKELNK